MSDEVKKEAREVQVPKVKWNTGNLKSFHANFVNASSTIVQVV